MSCSPACNELQIKCCESPTISVGLTAGDTFMAVLSRPGSKKTYKREAIIDATGSFTIDKDDLPDGFFGYGYINVELRKDAPEFVNIQPMTFNGKEFDCVILEIADIDED